MYTYDQFLSDIPFALARDAYNNTSHDPDRRGKGEQTEWATCRLEDYQQIMNSAKDDDQRAVLEELFADYYKRLLKKKLDLLHSHSGIASSFIVGPANFPAARMEKRHNAYQNKVNEYLEFRSKAMNRILKHFADPVGIRTGSANAVEALEAKIAKAEAHQEKMKAVNALIRKHLKAEPEEKAAALIDELGLTPSEAYAILKPNCFGGIGYEHFDLSNNSANIRRMKDQLEKAKKLAVEPQADQEINGVRIVDNQEADRLQMFFPVERVDRNIYDLLKAHGFRHTPSIKGFQAYRGANANYWAKKIAEEFGKGQACPPK